jgi:oxalate decarboxylase/phosphoglucose isomerase-like protein (cupin superfamily)
MLVNLEQVLILKKDKRGTIYNFSTRESSYFIVLYREKGSVSGNHYHKGTIKSKVPEIFYLASGEIELLVRDIKTGKEERHIVQEKTKIEIPPYIYHEVKALTDIILLDFNVSKEDFKGYESDSVKSKNS